MAKVQVEQGWLEGEVVQLVTGDGQFYSFKGIPYAAPPVGTLRFKAPQPPLPWKGVRNAKEHGPVSPQVKLFPEKGSEDCLYLNVYTKDIKPEEPRAVMVFIHGGGYIIGSGNDNNYGGDFLVQHDVVLVTINYRLEALGFLCMDTKEVPGNAGLKDQVAALKWVKKNIALFGGDPNNVTVFGESAGGACAALHVISPMSKGLFQRAISMSGVPTCDWSLSFESRRRAFTFGRLLGIHTNDPDVLLEKLQALPVEKLVDVRAAVLDSERIFRLLKKFYYFSPVVEKDFGSDHFLTEDVEESLRRGKVNDVDVMFGHTDMEGLSGIPKFTTLYEQYDKFPETLVPRKIVMNCTPQMVLKISDKIRERYFGVKPVSESDLREFIFFLNMTDFEFDIQRFARQLPKVEGRSRYFYQFSAVSGRNVFGNEGTPYGIVGAGHLDDLMYLFHAKAFNLPIDKSSKECKMIRQTCELFTNFAKYGNPTPDNTLGVNWQQYDNGAHFLDIGETLTPLTTFHEEELAFWQSVYDEANELTSNKDNI